MGIEDKIGAWACKSVDAKLDDTVNNDNFFTKLI